MRHLVRATVLGALLLIGTPGASADVTADTGATGRGRGAVTPAGFSVEAAAGSRAGSTARWTGVGGRADDQTFRIKIG